MKEGKARFYADSRAYVTVIKKGALEPHMPVEVKDQLKIRDVTSGECRTLGGICIGLNGLQCEAHIRSE